MDSNVTILENVVYDDGLEGITVFRIPMPHAGTGYGETIPRTFINSTLITAADGNSGVNLWPMYTVDKDLEAQAQAVWEQALPSFTHVGIVSDQISLYSGAIHCVTRTIPALPLTKWVADGTCTDGQCAGPGYDGACIPNSEETPGCWGPKWACLCNDCTLASCLPPETCGNGTCEATEGCYICPDDCGCANGESCNVVTNKCGVDLCGNGTCDAGESCVTCVSDCGCKNGETCSFGVCSADPCGGMTDVGCCDGNTMVYCDGGSLVATDCGASKCGWIADKNWYDCGNSTAADPSGESPFECKGNYDYPPGCDGKECGDNGGGYSCGTCAAGKECVNGTCTTTCTPACTGKACGDDGCGGTCGTCEAGTTCNDAGACIADCVVACTDKECGDDGCGGQCGVCADGATCGADGKCEAACVPACDGKTCGDDGCGGDCGTCGEGQTCSTAGVCEDPACVPVCDGKSCGDDGCGGTCGTCADGETCGTDGVCAGTDVPDGGDSGGGCSVALENQGRSASAEALLMLSMLLALVWIRKFVR